MTTLPRAAARALGFGLFVLVALGCQQPTQESVVTGEVTLDGAPLKKGLIRFVPTDGKARPADGEVTDGKYQVKVAPGECKVEVTAPKVVGKKKMYDTPDSPEVEEIAELIPAKYNAKSELSMTVGTGKQEKKFEVLSK